MSLDGSTSIAVFLERLAGREPTPGGGAASGLMLAIGAAQLAMVLRYSIGRKSSAGFDSMLQAGVDRTDKVAALGVQLMIEDQEAYAAYRDAKTSGDEKALKEASARCLLVPQTLIALAEELGRAAEGFSAAVNPWMRSDFRVAMASLRAAISGAGAIAKVNIDASDAAAIQHLDAKVKSAIGLIDRVVEQIR